MHLLRFAPSNSNCTLDGMNTKYPKLTEQAKRIASETCRTINNAAHNTEDEGMPYKAQYILEEVIKILKEQV